MRWAKIVTIAVLVLTAVIWIVWDVIALINGGVEATISRIIYRTAKEYLVLPFAMGFLCGHWFWPQNVGERIQALVKGMTK